MSKFTVIGVYEEQGQICSHHVEAATPKQAFFTASVEYPTMSMVACLPGHLAEGEHITFPGTFLAHADTILEQGRDFDSPTGELETQFLLADLDHDYAYQVVNGQLYMHPKTPDGDDFDWGIYRAAAALHQTEYDKVSGSVLEEYLQCPVALLADETPYEFAPLPHGLRGRVLPPSKELLAYHVVIFDEYDRCVHIVGRQGTASTEHSLGSLSVGGGAISLHEDPATYMALHRIEDFGLYDFITERQQAYFLKFGIKYSCPLEVTDISQ